MDTTIAHVSRGRQACGGTPCSPGTVQGELWGKQGLFHCSGEEIYLTFTIVTIYMCVVQWH